MAAPVSIAQIGASIGVPKGKKLSVRNMLRAKPQRAFGPNARAFGTPGAKPKPVGMD